MDFAVNLVSGLPGAASVGVYRLNSVYDPIWNIGGGTPNGYT